MSSVYEKISSALSSLGSRKRSAPDSTSPRGDSDAGGHGSAGSRPAKRQATFRPWDQKALHTRLETFRPLTWFAKPASVSAVACASKGWINEGRDALCCEMCSSKLLYPQNVSYDQKQAAAELFAPLLASRHGANCPWRSTSCADSLLAYTPSSNTDLCSAYAVLQDKLLGVDILPDLDLLRVWEIRAVDEEPFDLHMMGQPVLPKGPPPIKISVNGEAGPGPSSTAASAAASAQTLYIQPSKLTAQQKANLLALLGWDADVLTDPNAGGGMSSLMQQAGAYSLQHLLGRRTSRAGTGTGSGSGGQAMAPKHSMTSVVLKCHLCNSRVGLWNFAHTKPCPTGRFTTGAASEQGGVSGPAGPLALASRAAADPLAMTIAGGKFDPASRALGAPARFGQTGPVFGVHAPDTRAPPPPSVPVPVSSQTASQGPPSSAQQPGHSLKRKASDMEMRDAAGAGPFSTSSSSPAAAAASGLSDGSKRARGADPAPTSPSAAAGGAGLAAAGASGSFGAPQQQHMLDPVTQHKSWCPWVFTGDMERHVSPNPKFACGWQHCLSALHGQAMGPGAGAAAAAAAAGGMAEGEGGAVPHKRNASQLKDELLSKIRKM